MYLAGVSVRRVEDITEALWGARVSPSTVSDFNKKICATIYYTPFPRGIGGACVRSGDARASSARFPWAMGP